MQTVGSSIHCRLLGLADRLQATAAKLHATAAKLHATAAELHATAAVVTCATSSFEYSIPSSKGIQYTL
jgi:hypothetical protein